MKLLIVDDEARIRALIAKYAAFEGYETDEAENGMQAVILDRMIDTSFISQLEQRNEHYKFMRIDSDLTDAMKAEDGETSKEVVDDLTGIFRKALSNDKLNIRVEKLKDDNISSVLTVSEEGRRMQDMMKM